MVFFVPPTDFFVAYFCVFLDFPLSWFLRGLLYIAQLQFFDLAQCHYKSRSNTFVYSSENIGGIVFVARNVPSFLSNDLTDIWSLQLGSVNARINGITSLDKARLLGLSSLFLPQCWRKKLTENLCRLENPTDLSSSATLHSCYYTEVTRSVNAWTRMRLEHPTRRKQSEPEPWGNVDECRNVISCGLLGKGLRLVLTGRWLQISRGGDDTLIRMLWLLLVTSIVLCQHSVSVSSPHTECPEKMFLFLDRVTKFKPNFLH